MSERIYVGVTDIKYDTDGQKIHGLKNCGWFSLDKSDFDESAESDFSVVADAISDATGWAVESFSIDKIAPYTPLPNYENAIGLDDYLKNGLTKIIKRGK
jgi:hypothetical protein